MSEPMDPERLAEIERQLEGEWGTYESDLPLYGAAWELLEEVKRLRLAIATTPEKTRARS